MNPIALLMDNAVNALTPLVSRLFPIIRDYIARNRRLARALVWALCIVILLLLTTAFLFGLHAVFSSYKPGIVVSVVLWSLFLGITASAVLPSKVIITTFGALLGISATEIITTAGLISIIRKQVTAIAIELGAIVNPAGPVPEHPDAFISWMVWLFIGIIGVLCLPAFFESEGT